MVRRVIHFFVSIILGLISPLAFLAVVGGCMDLDLQDAFRTALTTICGFQYPVIILQEYTENHKHAAQHARCGVCNFFLSPYHFSA